MSHLVEVTGHLEGEPEELTATMHLYVRTREDYERLMVALANVLAEEAQRMYPNMPPLIPIGTESTQGTAPRSKLIPAQQPKEQSEASKAYQVRLENALEEQYGYGKFVQPPKEASDEL